jgi:hypothetical protein
VIAIFSTAEKRDVFLQEYVKLSKDVEAKDFALDPDIPTVVQCTSVFMDKDGNVNMRMLRFCACDIATAGFRYFTQGGGFLHWTVATDDAQRAIKVVNEKRGQILALNAWGDNTLVKALFAARDAGEAE